MIVHLVMTTMLITIVVMKLPLRLRNILTTHQKRFVSVLLSHSLVGHYLDQALVPSHMPFLLLQDLREMNMLLLTGNNPTETRRIPFTIFESTVCI